LLHIIDEVPNKNTQQDVKFLMISNITQINNWTCDVRSSAVQLVHCSWCVLLPVSC